MVDLLLYDPAYNKLYEFYLYSIVAFIISAMLYYPRARNLKKTHIKNISTPNLTGGDILTLMLKEAKCENVKIRVYKKPGMEKQKKSLLSEKYNHFYPDTNIIDVSSFAYFDNTVAGIAAVSRAAAFAILHKRNSFEVKFYQAIQFISWLAFVFCILFIVFCFLTEYRNPVIFFLLLAFSVLSRVLASPTENRVNRLAKMYLEKIGLNEKDMKKVLRSNKVNAFSRNSILAVLFDTRI